MNLKDNNILKNFLSRPLFSFLILPLLFILICLLPEFVDKFSFICWLLVLTFFVVGIFKSSLLYINIFFINACFAIFVYYSNVELHNREFLRGGDDEQFYLMAHYYKDQIGELLNTELRYKAYLVLLVFGIKCYTGFLVGSDVLFLMLFKAFLSIPSYYFFIRLVEQYTNDYKIKNTAFIFFVFNPLVLYYNVILLRDSTILTCFLVCALVSHKIGHNKLSSKYYISSFVALIFLVNVRVGSFLFVLLYFAFTVSRKRFGKFNLFNHLANCIIIVTIALTIYLPKNYQRTIQNTNEEYNELREQTNYSSNSYATKILNSNLIFMLPVQIAYVGYGGAPVILNNINIFSIVYTLGQVMVYIVMFIITRNIFTNLNYAKHDIIYLCVCSFLVAKTSGDPRHFAFLLPIAVIQAARYYYNNEEKEKFGVVVFSMVIAITGFVYLQMKGII